MQLLGTIRIFSKCYTVCSAKWFIWSNTCNHTKPTYIVFKLNVNKANLRDLIAATSLVISHWIQIVKFSTCVTVKFDGWPRKKIGHFFYTTPSFVHHFISIYSPETLDSGGNWWYLILCDLQIWGMTLENNRAHLVNYTKFCASFQSHRWSQTWVTVRKCSSRVKIGDFFYLEIWWMTLKNNRTPLLYYIKVCASFQSHGWI